MGIETDLNVPPYFADYDEAKKYYQMIHRPKLPVQARELTDAQTMLQKQIERFGNHIFKDGSIVDGVAITYYPKVHYISLEDTFNTNSELFVTDFDNSYLITNSTNSNNAVRAAIKIAKNGIKASHPDTNRIYFDYIATGTDGSNNDVNVFAPGDTLYFYSNVQSKLGTLDANNLVDSINTLASNGTFTSNGYAYCVGVSDGMIFQKGYFQLVDPQVITVKDYTTNVTNYVVGFNTTESIVTESEDTTLLDGSLGYSNENAPGAHRLKLSPTLVAKLRTDASNSTNFFAIVEFDGEEPTEQKDDPEYSELQNQLSRRTYEESGDYVIKPFQIETRTTSNTQTFYYEVSTGIAYVRGNRIEKIGPTKVEVERATTTEVAQNQIVTANYGNYVICDEYLGAFDFEQLSEVALYDAPQNAISEYEGISSAPSGSIVGYANVKGVSFEEGTKGSPTARYLVYLFNIRMNTGKSFSTDVKSMYVDGAFGKAKADIVLENSQAVIKESSRTTLVFDTGLSAIKRLTNNTGIGDTTYNYNQIKAATLAANGVVTLTLDTAAAGASTERLTATTGSILTGSSIENYNILLTANAYTANLAGTIQISSGNTAVVGTDTAFTTDTPANSIVRIYANTTSTHIRRVVSVSNNTYLTLDAPITASNTLSTFGRYFPGGTPLPINAVTINSNTSFTANAGYTFASGSQSVNCTYPVMRDQATAIPKVIRKNRFVKIDCSNNAATTVGPWNLGVVDAHKLRHVYVGTTYANTNPDRLAWFNLDTGQRDEYYDHARLVIKPQYAGNISSATRILVEFDAFTANTAASVGFFSVESYPIDDANTANTTAIQTAELPLYGNKELRNMIDFRPIKFNTANVDATAAADATINPAVSNTSFSVPGTGQYIISPDTNFTADFEFYLPRYDVVTIDPNGTFNVNKGVPSQTPIAPFVENDQSVIAEAFVPAYPSLTKREYDTYKSTPSIKVNLRTNRRYTMKDIGALEERIKRTEYYTVLNALEQQARDLTVPDENGLNRFKNGIFADPFNSHNIGDVSNFEYKIAIDQDNSLARPYFMKHDADFEFKSANSANVVQTGPLVTLTYDDEKHISQRFATKFRITTESLWKWNGLVDLYPSYDFFRDEDTAPNVNINLDLAAPWEAFANSPWGTHFGEWRDVSSSTATSVQNTGQSIVSTTTTSTTQNREVTTLNVNTFTEQYSIGSYVKDVSINPYMRSRLVAFVSTNLKPNTTLHVFFDDVLVDSHCAPGVLSGISSVEAGREDRVVTQNGNFGDALVSDANGFVCGLFRIPAETFRTGDRLFQINNVDDLVTGASAIITNGRATYTADNIAVTKETTTLNVRQPLLFRQSVVDTRVQTTSVTDVTIIPIDTGGGDGGGGGGSCFVAGTKVTMADGTLKNIEDVKIGDIVRGYATDNLVIDYDHPLLSNGRDPILYGFNGGPAFVTSEHPFYTSDDKWKSIEPSETKRLKPHLDYLNVSKLGVGDSILMDSGNFFEILSIEKYDNQPTQRVYNLVLNGDNTYYADGLLAHNRDPIAQSFNITNVPSSVSSIFITKIGVYFKAKDQNLGCTVFVCEMVNGVPDMSRIVTKGHLPASSITTSDDGSSETQFVLEYPACLLVNNDYAFVVQPDGYSPEYTIWVGETGNFDVDTNEQVFSNPYSGIMFISANKKTWTAIQKEDIKFNVYRAKFNTSSGTAIFKNENDEYFTIDGFTKANSSLRVEVGDQVYTVNSSANTANTANLINHVLSSNSSPSGRIQYVNEADGNIWLDSSTGGFSNSSNPTIAVFRNPTPSNTSLLNANTLIAYGNILTVDNLKYHAVVPKFGTIQPAKTSTQYEFKGVSNAAIADSAFTNVSNEYEHEFLDIERQVMSRSNEITSLSSGKSAEFKITLQSASDFVSPAINLSRKSMLFVENLINNDSTNEHTRYGAALSKYVSKKIILADGQEAEDLEVYLTAYKPYDTEIEIYAKFRNNQDQDPFEDRVWSKLSYTNGGEYVYSSPTNTRDYIEFKFGLPSINAVATGAFANTNVDTYSPLTGTITIANNSNVITGTGTAFSTELSVGQVIRVVSNDYFAIRTITSISNNTSLSVDNGLAASNSAALHYVFGQDGNDGILEYDNASGSRFIGYKEFALKIVLLSSNPVKVPRLNDVRALCLQR